MAMANEEDIASFMAISGGARQDAIQFLQGAGGNLSMAMDQYFENPGKYQNQATYDESAWTQERYGEYQQADNIPSFQIDAPDEIGASQYPLPHSTAPSRPPSRASHRSATPNSMRMESDSVSGRDSVMDWTKQEIGVIGSSGTYFGPANRPEHEYDPNQWALTTVAGTKEYIPDVNSAADRKRDGQPAFLKPLVTKDEYLPGLITILNHIPASRQALLAKDSILPVYGYDHNWWSGTPITLPKTTHAEEDSSAEEDAFSLDVTHETQRIMAFLKDTERAYGSAEPLQSILDPLDFAGLDIFTDWSSLVHRFLTAWTYDVRKRADDALAKDDIFTSYISRQEPGQSMAEHQFPVLDLDLNQPAHDVGTLYDALDERVWSENRDGIDDGVNIAIQDFAQIFVVRVRRTMHGEGKGLGIPIPSGWYADRYAVENMEAAKKMRQDMAKCRAEHERYEASIKSLTNFTIPNVENPVAEKVVEGPKLLASVVNALKYLGGTRLDEMSEEVPNQEAFQQETARQVEQLERVIQSIERKLERLNRKMEQVKVDLEQHSSLLKLNLPSQSGPLPRLRYQLRGVCTDNYSTYVLLGSQEWRRIHYSSDAVISNTILPEDEVLKAASEDSKTVLLVYASDQALEPVDDALPEPLKNFVETDNVAFREELRSEEPFQGIQLDNDADSMTAEAPELRESNFNGGGWDRDVNTSWDAQHIEHADVEMKDMGC